MKKVMKNTLRKYGNACLLLFLLRIFHTNTYTHTPQLEVYIQEENRTRTIEANQSK